MISIPPALAPLVGNIESTSNIMDLLPLFQTAVQQIPDFTSIDTTRYQYQGFFITIMLSTYATPFLETLEKIKPLQLASAPVLVKHIALSPVENVLITAYADVDHSSQLRPYEEASNLVTPEGKQRFIQDLHTLMDNSLIHRYAVKGTASWMVNTNTGHIVLYDWGSVKPLEEGQREQVIQSLQSIKERLK